MRDYTDPNGLKVVGEFFYVESSKKGGNKGITEIVKFLKGHRSVAYEDKLDGNITRDDYNRLSKKWNTEQRNLLDTIERYQQANHLYFEQGVQLLELAQRVPSLYPTKSAREKRKLLDFVLSNSIWKGSNLTAKFRQPFDMLAVTNTTWKAEKAAGVDSDGLRSIWLRR